MNKVAVITLGCPKNTVDSENILAILATEGWIITDSHGEADIIIINTCAFIKKAVEEGLDTIFQVLEEKKPGSKLIVYGCLTQRAGEKILGIEGVDGAAGTGDPAEILNTINNLKNKKPAINTSIHSRLRAHPRLVSTYPYAYLKISEGCSNHCSYCLIPQLRGEMRSRPAEDVIEEARALYNSGRKELIVISQDSANYGKDLDEDLSIEHLLTELVKIDFRWIRLMYLHPAHINDSLLNLIANEKKICRYLDMPLQHAHPDMLSLMNRPPTDCMQLVDRIREKLPDIRLRTTFITGFPGETKKHFRYLMDFVDNARLDMVGVFKYSKEEGTAAASMKRQVAENEKEARALELMEMQKTISAEKLKRLEGSELEVIIDGPGKEHYEGRPFFFAPEIDGRVYVKSTRELKTGSFNRVRITGSDSYDLYGTAC